MIRRPDPEQAKPEQPERIHPIDEFSIGALMGIPLGAQVLVVDYAHRTSACGDWSEENRDHMVEMVQNQPGADASKIFVAWVDPMPDSGFIADTVVWENYGPDGDAFIWEVALEMCDGDEDKVTGKLVLDLAIGMGHLDGDGIMAMLRNAARLGGAK